MDWLAVSIEILLFGLLNFEKVKASTFTYQIPSLLSSSVLLHGELAKTGLALTPLGFLELAWFCIAILALAQLIITRIRRSEA